MNWSEPIKVIELRNYLLKPGMRDRFIEYFEKHFVESQNILGGFVLGTFRIESEPDRFFWIRGFSDMASRSRYLPEFYGGEVWKEFGPEANAMMLEWQRVHLLKPLEEIKAGDFRARLTAIDFYLAGEDKFAGSVDPVRAENAGTGSVWVSEMTENDFPRLPVIQAENLVVAITNYRDRAEFEAAGRKDRREVEKTTLVLFPTEKFLEEKGL
jgi:hypothetical protein